MEMNDWIQRIDQQITNEMNTSSKSISNPILLAKEEVMSHSLDRLPKVGTSSTQSKPILIPGQTSTVQFRAQSYTKSKLPIANSHMTRSWSSYIPSGDRDQDQDHNIEFKQINPLPNFKTRIELDKIWCQGFVYKLNSGIGMKTWKRYWLVCRRGKLISYKNQLVLSS